MNKRIVYSALFFVVWIFASCNKETPSPGHEEPRVLSFAAEQIQNRGASTSSADEILSLGIFGYSTGTEAFNANDPSTLPNLFWNQLVTRDDKTVPWTYDPVAYWPIDPAIQNTFFAYSPYYTEFPEESFIFSSEDNSGYPFLYYRVPTILSEQVDLLYSVFNSNVTNINYDTNAGKVKYTMSHALGWIRFLIAPMPEDDEDPNASYSIHEFNMSGGNIVTAGQFNLGTAAWTPLDMSDVIYEFDDLHETPLKAQVGNVTEVSEDCLMLLPQNIVQSQNLTTINLKFTYDDGTNGEQSDTEYYVTAPFPDVRISAGNVILYIVRVSKSGILVEFTDENTIENWLEDEEDREIPIH